MTALDRSRMPYALAYGRYSPRLVASARRGHDVLQQELRNAAALDFLQACFTGQPEIVVRHLAHVFMRINPGISNG